MDKEIIQAVVELVEVIRTMEELVEVIRTMEDRLHKLELQAEVLKEALAEVAIND